jgi:mono/diheme cytochrome c family protein
VQVSRDGKKWRDLGDERTSKSDREKLTGLEGKGRFLRVLCLADREKDWSRYSIEEVTLAGPAGKAVEKQVEAYQREVAQRRRRAGAELVDIHGCRYVVFAERHSHHDGHWYANFGYYADDADRKAYRRGGGLKVLDLQTGREHTIIDAAEGVVRDPAIHYDGRTVVFSYMPAERETFNLYKLELEIGSDGSVSASPPERLTVSDTYDDIEPCWLPDGGIMFVSGRGKRWVNCWHTQVAILYRCDGDGGNVRQISANIEHDNTPWPLDDGRVIYQRWEYVDRSQVKYHHLWSANPDGTNQMVYFGNLHPGEVYIDAKGIPGTDDVVLIASPGHGRRDHDGRVAILSVKKGPDARGELKKITGEHDFRDPWALDARTFLACRDKQLVLLNRDGDRMVLHELQGQGRGGLHEARCVLPRPVEKRIPSRVDWSQPTGRLFLADVYEGRSMAQVRRGTIKNLLVLETLPKPINYTGSMEPVSWGGTFTLERIVGKIPVAEDGSAYMELPALRAFFFLALDENDSAVRRMQSFTSVMPGEMTSCTGCHEARTRTLLTRAEGNVLTALRRGPDAPRSVEGVPEVFDYPRDIQPILDKHCVKCHNPDNRKGRMLLTGDRGPLYSHSYWSLIAYRQVSVGRNRARSNYAPYQIGDPVSPLMDKLDGRHHGGKLAPAEIKRIRYWIHSGAAWIGTYAALDGGMVGGDHSGHRLDRIDTKWKSHKGYTQVLEKRCSKCHTGDKSIPTAISDNKGMNPERVRLGSEKIPFLQHIVFNLTRPEKSLVCLAPLASDAGGIDMVRRDKDGKPTGEVVEIFESTDDPDYQKILAFVRDGKERLEQIKWWRMDGYRPPLPYLREMVRYGVLPSDFDLESDPIDFYAVDRKYWRSLWHKPR